MLSWAIFLSAAAMGADPEAHWAYQRPEKPPAPQVADPAWQSNPIDAFIYDALSEQGLKPVERASWQTLIRRAYYDLTGLPPSPEEVEAFVEKASPEAYEALIDELLASPRYGEKWGRHWLDVVRYADSNGYERDSNKPHIWRYRDYVIDSFNQDKPYDRFIREQLAGDELEEVTPESLTATGFYRLGIWDDEPVDLKQARYDVLDNVVDTTAQAFLGVTMGCARCHEHKIDPIAHEEYYQFLAFFDNVTDIDLSDQMKSVLPDEEQAARREKLDAKREKELVLRHQILATEHALRTRLAESVDGFKDQPLTYSDLEEVTFAYYEGDWDRLPEFGDVTPVRAGDAAFNYISTHPAERDTGYGLVYEGRVRVPQDGPYYVHLMVEDACRLYVDGELLFECTLPGTHIEDVELELKKGYASFRFEVFVQSKLPVVRVQWTGPGFKRRPWSVDGGAYSSRDVPDLLKKHGAETIGAERTASFEKWREEYKQLRDNRVPGGRWASVVAEKGPEYPETYVFLRGNAHALGQRVEPGFPAAIDDGDPEIVRPDNSPQTTGLRLALANWIASPENPLTARVMANRIWQHHFGEGIVKSPNNFGLLAAPPTHPELLDWLAVTFMEEEWSVNALHKLIMTSQTYQLSTRGDDLALAKDPANNLHWRFDLRRLTAEEVRDSILAVSGDLNLKAGGPGFYPELPEEALATSSQPQNIWGESPAEELGRRSVYIHVKRSLLTPLLTDFDFADTDATCEVRFVTTLPTQALNMLNSEFVNEQAVAFAERLQEEAGENLRDRVALGLSLATSRPPTDREIDMGMAFLADVKDQAGIGDAKAMQRFALLALNLNEFMYVQ